MSRPIRQQLLLFLASGLGVGFLPGAKGTYGTVVGIGLYFLFHWSEKLPLFLALTGGGVLASIWIAGRAETILGRKDAQEIVIDEAACFPVAMLGFVALGFPGNSWFAIGLAFVIFRVLDILKPPPIRQLQKVKGGWGVVLDDLVAALLTALLSALLLLAWSSITRSP